MSMYSNMYIYESYTMFNEIQCVWESECSEMTMALIGLCLHVFDKKMCGYFYRNVWVRHNFNAIRMFDVQSIDYYYYYQFWILSTVKFRFLSSHTQCRKMIQLEKVISCVDKGNIFFRLRCRFIFSIRSIRRRRRRHNTAMCMYGMAIDNQHFDQRSTLLHTPTHTHSSVSSRNDFSIAEIIVCLPASLLLFFFISFFLSVAFVIWTLNVFQNMPFCTFTYTIQSVLNLWSESYATGFQLTLIHTYTQLSIQLIKRYQIKAIWLMGC